MNKKILLDMLKKARWSILVSAILLFFVYPRITHEIFSYFCFVQFWLILNSLRLDYQQEFNNEIKECANAASKMIVVIKSNLDELKKIYQEVEK